jgi:sugar phosphate isomerase/epimerase
MFWPWHTPAETIREAVNLGVRSGQLGMPGDADLADAPSWKAACEQQGFSIVTVFAAYKGESYADIATVERTVGLVPESTRRERLERTLLLSDFARRLGAPGIACHIGFIPHDPAEILYGQMLDIVRTICDHAASNNQTFALETGQEPAQVLRQFVQAVGRTNLRINFDPANMILYGTGDPMEAAAILAPWIETVHAKEGDWPAAAGALGAERRLGEGSVGMERFVAKLREVGYCGGLFVEREVEDLPERLADMRHGVDLLRKLTGVTQ